MSAGRVPLEVGTRGTIGSLLKREIDYFRKAEVERAHTASEETPSASGGRGFKFSISNWTRKMKRRRSSDRDSHNQIPGFGYLNLKAHSHRYDDV
ncbi:uncharacterized protein LOC125188029 [Salvia hispanica]|uniref:uncharacterized protein LOC125188029 n=1 Tax=Salvia hispanica TaxID=49212 RepID=UPI0020097E56|nr:uncharacterized protein LOC125188029 [Salvia hispanica]